MNYIYVTIIRDCVLEFILNALETVKVVLLGNVPDGPAKFNDISKATL